MVSLPKVWKQTSNLPVQPAFPALSARAVLLFDIDGVIRDVAASYRRAIVETVHQFSGWRPQPAQIDALKSEGCWNNDWEASRELLRRHGQSGGLQQDALLQGCLLQGDQPSGRRSSSNPRSSEPPAGSSDPEGLPAFDTVVAAFSDHYFGGDPEGDPILWRGFIGQEPLLVGPEFFAALSAADILWGFVSGAEPPSVRYVLQGRLGLQDPPFIAMGDAPDKPDPTGLLRLAEALLAARGTSLGPDAPAVAYLGDTVADVQTVLRARERVPAQRFLSLAVAPPHLHGPGQDQRRHAYEQQLLAAGADRIMSSTDQAGAILEALLA
jgi:HAD superfamily phosphatase